MMLMMMCDSSLQLSRSWQQHKTLNFQQW